MKTIQFHLVLVTCLWVSAGALLGQGTAFTYQGRLNAGANPTSGSYDLTFTLFNAVSGPAQVGTTFTNSATVVSNGLFTVTLDFGANFPGSDRWLEIAVRTNSGSTFTTLTPRQKLTPTPYAIYASNAANAATATSATSATTASSFTGTLAGDVTGTQGATVVSSVGGQPANLVAGGASAANAATSAATANAIVKRDASGGINAGGINATNFTGNGGGLTNVDGTLIWQVVSGTTQSAQRNTGYVLTNNSLVTVTLPATPGLGDVVRVSGNGINGWKIAQRAGQSVLTAILPSQSGSNWTPQDTNRNWISVASSSDGAKLVAVDNGGHIHVSTDSGANWTARANARNWEAVTSSADGTKLVAVVEDGQIYTSTDSGVTWGAHDTNRTWVSVASSQDGSKLVAVDSFGTGSGGQIYTSTDSGTNWTAHASNRQWQSVASSADGTKLVAVVYNGQIYTSVDSGTNWTARASIRTWESVASSADGTKLVAVDIFGTGSGGLIYTSTDSGTNWLARPGAPATSWIAAASSADGTKIVAVALGGQVYTSADSGLNWTARESNRAWQCAASSADGTKLVAVVGGGQIYTSTASSTAGPTGFLLGDQNSAIELQYFGNGQFLPISYVGTIQAY